ncbi:hypothetical protein ACFQU2_39055 [Siccirubricoccus deserti]
MVVSTTKTSPARNRASASGAGAADGRSAGAEATSSTRTGPPSSRSTVVAFRIGSR